MAQIRDHPTERLLSEIARRAAPELRREGDGTVTISGTASEYRTWYTVGHFQERVMPGAAAAALAASPEVLLTAEHDRSRAIARTPQTLSLREDGAGLHYRATVDVGNDADACSVVSKIERAVFVESSFAFRVPTGGDIWNDDRTERTIHGFDLDHGGVSVVPFGASPTTTVNCERTLVGSLQERRALAQTISSTGWCGPWLTRAFDLRQSWAHQHGQSCPDCDDSGDCSTSDGKGWGVKRSALPPNDTDDLRLELALIDSRAPRRRTIPEEMFEEKVQRVLAERGPAFPVPSKPADPRATIFDAYRRMVGGA